MLPSCGHFKNIPCPFYKLALCVRPHCPYKHETSENGHQRQLFAPIVDETESLLDSNLSKSSYHSPTTEIQKNVTYIPTPVDGTSKPPGILKKNTSNSERSSSSVPEYKPTPISKLKEFNSTTNVKSSRSEYSPEYPVPIRKKKNVEEYDPTEVKCISKKTVTFVDQTDCATDVPVVLISSDEDDPENAPRFSDDDFDEPPNTVSQATKQVPDVIEIEVIDEPKIDKFSVVDKILVDCKKNEILLNAYQRQKLPTKKIDNLSMKADTLPTKVDILQIKTENLPVKSENLPVKADIISVKAEPLPSKTVNLHAKTDALPTKVFSVEKHNKNKPYASAKSEAKSNKCNNSHPIKIEKIVADSKLDDKKVNIIKVKKCDSPKKHIKSEKSELAKKVKQVSSSHSSNTKDKSSHSKETDKSKQSKKISHETKKHSSGDSKNLKSDAHSFSKPLDKVKSKKGIEDHRLKQVVSDSSFNKKKNKSETEKVHNLKFSDSNTKSNEKGSRTNSLKRKFDNIDSVSEQHLFKNKSSSDMKIKSGSNISPVKRKKSVDSVSSDRTKPQNDKCSESDIDDTMLNDLLSCSDSDSDPDEECRRIFNECYPEDSVSPKDNKEESSLPTSSKSPELIFLKKKRFAHPAAAELKPPAKQAKTEIKRPLNPAQVMHNRFAMTQAKYAQLENKDNMKNLDKKRINFAPNQSLLDAIRNKNQGNSPFAKFSPLPSTVSKSLKVTKRTAHIPEAAMKPRPIIPAEYGSKVPPNLRQKYLNAFIDECLKFCLSEAEAYDLALEEEKKVYDRISSKNLYLNVAANALKRLRNQAEEGPKSKKGDSTGVSSRSNSSKSDKKTVSHEAVLNGPLAQRRSFSIGRKKETPVIRGGVVLYEYLLPYVMSLEQLKENSYPLPHPTEKDRAIISGVYAGRTLYCNDAFKRTCTRCHKTYYVNVDGDYVRDEECDFHWGRIWKKRIAGNLESRYSCCQGDAESDGCCVSPGHVFDGSEAHVLKGYISTLPKSLPPDNCYGIYALDCEMCYTTAGLELTRITVVDTDMKPVYESFVKPQHKVLDYNTRFSGITEDDLKNVRTTIHDVQAVLLCIFNNKTILIGHSLESDFKALKLFHSTVIDTSVVFPHKSGPPFKRALRTLMAENLNKIIQNDVGGHDSQEDAVACMELMLWKVKEDARSNR